MFIAYTITVWVEYGIEYRTESELRFWVVEYNCFILEFVRKKTPTRNDLELEFNTL